MANYPGSNPSFTTKQDGVDYPQAAHINGVQDEIVAIGTALRGTLAHAINVGTGGLTVSSGGLTVAAGGLTVSSGGATISTGSVNIGGPSSVATLQVNGASTFTGNVTMAGSLTVGGLAVVGGLGSMPNVRVSKTGSTYAISSGWNGISWDVEDFDSTGLHSTSASSSRINLTSSGLWLLGGQVAWNAESLSSTEYLGARIVLNDVSVVSGVKQFVVNAPSTNLVSFIGGVMHYTGSTTDYVTLQCYKSGATNITFRGSTGADLGPTNAWAIRLAQ